MEWSMTDRQKCAYVMGKSTKNVLILLFFKLAIDIEIILW